MKRFWMLLFLLLFTGCDLIRGLNLPTVLQPGGAGTPTMSSPTAAGPAGTASPAPGTPGAAGTPNTGTPVAAGTPGATPSGALGPEQALTLWVPPEFDPDNGSAAGALLRKRLDLFSRQNGGVPVEVRVKASSGPGGLIESLNAASAVAPLALPSVVALPRTDLEIAALKGLVYPLDGISTAIDQPDWYDYARQLSMVQGATFALPFAGDALVVAYRPGSVAIAPTDINAIYRLGQPLAFPAGDAQALFVLSLYQSMDGAVEDAQRRPTLQPEILSQVLQIMADGEQRGIFPFWLSQYETSGQVWQAYRDLRVNALVTWVSTYLTNLPPDTTAVPMPSLDETPISLATGWGWAVADPDPERRLLAAQLAAFLADGDFLAGWTEAAGYMPTRPSSLAAWTNASLKTLLSPVAVSAQARPSNDQLQGLGSVLREATLKVLKRESDPTQAAQAASERLAVPEAK